MESARIRVLEITLRLEGSVGNAPRNVPLAQGRSLLARLVLELSYSLRVNASTHAQRLQSK